jgi:hypothetical protein
MKKGQYIQHINLSDWGTGRVVERQGGFIVVVFPVGRKKIKAEFLRIVEGHTEEHRPKILGQREDSSSIATKLWLDKLNKTIAKSVAEGTVPFLGSYLEHLTDEHRNRFRQHLQLTNDPIATFIFGLRKWPASFAAFLTAKLSECYGEENLRIYEPIAAELGVNNIPLSRRHELHDSFCKAIQLLGLETAEREPGHQSMVADYMKQSGLPLNHVARVIKQVHREIALVGQPD